MTRGPANAIVIGGGVAGLWTARALAQRGVETTVLERKAPGAGASSGNAGWVCPGQAGPIPEPGLVTQGLRMLFDRESALYFAPRELPRMALWLAAFARHCTWRSFTDGVRALAQLGYPSFDLVADLAREASPPPRLDRSGLMIAASDPAVVERYLKLMAPLRELGHDLPAAPLGAEDLADLEPQLAGRASAVLISDHIQVDPAPFTQTLADRVRAAGVRIVEDAQVTGFEAQDGRVTAVRTTDSRLSADVVVLAAGAWTAPLARSLGAHLPIAGGKGYSVDVREPGWMPRHAILFTDTHLALSPLGDRLRIAGTMEFSGLNERIDQRRVDVMLARARELFGDWKEAAPPWAGLRPVAPDGLPIIGRLPRSENAYVAAGYTMLGMTISPAAGEFLAEQIVAGQRPEALAPFDPGRFLQLPVRRRAAA